MLYPSEKPTISTQANTIPASCIALASQLSWPAWIVDLEASNLVHPNSVAARQFPEISTLDDLRVLLKIEKWDFTKKGSEAEVFLADTVLLRDGERVFNRWKSLRLDASICCVQLLPAFTDRPDDRIELLRLAVENSMDSIIITDNNVHNPRILFANPAFERITGYTPSEYLGRNPNFLQGPKTERAKVLTLKARILEGKPVTISTWNYRKSGEPFMMEWIVMPVVDAQGQISCFAAVQRDITDQLVREQTSSAREQDMLVAFFRGQEEERRRISNELHDGLGQTLFLTRICLEKLLKKAKNGDVEALEESLALVQRAGGELRGIMAAMSPVDFNKESLPDALKHLLKLIQSNTETELHFAQTGKVQPLTPPAATSAYRIVQEAINNALKHAEAENIFVILHFGADRLELTIRDDGKGQDLAQYSPRTTETISGFGLGNMMMRAKSVGGDLHINSAPGEGTVVRARIPLDISRQNLQQLLDKLHSLPYYETPQPVAAADSDDDDE